MTKKSIFQKKDFLSKFGRCKILIKNYNVATSTLGPIERYLQISVNSYESFYLIHLMMFYCQILFMAKLKRSHIEINLGTGSIIMDHFS